jgi:pimeloyl-ACP methyl ester carboxylesterase
MWLDLLGAKVVYYGNKFSTRAIEAGQGTPLILLHGLGGHAETYSRNIIPLAQQHRVIAIDLLWHGLSSKPPFEGEAIPKYAEQVIDLLDDLGLESSHLEGNSLGGWIGLWLALHYSERVRKLVLNTTAGIRLKESLDHQSSVQRQNRARQLVETPSRENIRLRLEQFMASPDKATDELVELRYRFYNDPQTKDSLAVIFENAFGLGVSARFQISGDDLKQIKCPTLVLWGDHNLRAGCEVGEQIAALIPQAKFFCIRNAAHWSQWEQPQEHNRAVLAFLGNGEIRSV